MTDTNTPVFGCRNMSRLLFPGSLDAIWKESVVLRQRWDWCCGPGRYFLSIYHKAKPWMRERTRHTDALPVARTHRGTATRSRHSCHFSPSPPPPSLLAKCFTSCLFMKVGGQKCLKKWMRLHSWSRSCSWGRLKRGPKISGFGRGYAFGGGCG